MYRKDFSIVWKIAASLAAFCISKVSADDGTTSCTKSSSNIYSNNPQSFLMLVSTIDGRLTALNVRDRGRVAWTVDSGLGPLISSSLSKMEIMRNGALIRLVPSLDGGLYQYDGDSIEAVPITADTLLSSSYRINDDTVVVGGKEAQTYGIDVSSGKLQYTCTMDGCKYFSEREVRDSDDIIVVSRNIKTVRAVECRTGGEKWNFSVGQHDIQYLPGLHDATAQNAAMDNDEDVSIVTCPPDEEDNSNDKEDATRDANIRLNVVVPTGQVTARGKTDLKVIWTHKFSSPIAKAWTIDGGTLRELSLFDNNVVPALASSDSDDPGLPPEPFLYLGSYRDQVYVQPSATLQKAIDRSDGDVSHMVSLRVLWRPYLATAPSRTPALRGVRLPTITHVTPRSTSRSRDVQLWEDSYPYDTGYYLYADTSPVTIDNTSEEASADEQGDITITLWNWWREVAAISLITSVVFHLIITKYINKRPSEPERTTSQGSEEEETGSGRYDIVDEMKKLSESHDDTYESYYVKHFEHVQTLGSGGFGIVFEARKTMDDVNYAVKRIPIHLSDETEKSLREVRTLAKLDHVGIVAYKNSWIESPPPGWQESRDRVRLSKGPTSTSYSNFTSQDFLGAVPSRRDQFSINIPSDTSQGFTATKPDEDESGSFSFGQSGSPEKDSLADVESRNRNASALTTSHENLHKHGHALPTATDTTDSFIVFEDSGCSTHDIKNESLSDAMSRGSESEASSRDIRSACTPTTGRHHFLFIQMQLCQRENLKDWLSSHTLNRQRHTILDIFDQIVSAVAYVHHNGFIHRDLKPSNILFSMDGVVKIGDFGLVTATLAQSNDTDSTSSVSSEADHHTAQVGTTLYMSPEQVSGKVYTHKVDIYSLGMVLFELLYPFSTEMERVTNLTQLKAGVYPPRFVREMPEEHKVVQWLLSLCPDDRPTAEDIQNHELLEAYEPRRNLCPSFMQRSSSGSV